MDEAARPLQPEDPTRHSLLHRIRAGAGPDIWEEFAACYGPLIQNWCQRTGLGAGDCDELLQEVFRALLQALPSFHYRKEKGGFRAYLWRVVRNQALALRRRRLRQPLPLHPAAEETLTREGQEPDAVWEEEWRKHHLRRAWERLQRELPPHQLEVFRLHGLEARPAREVAERCGTTVPMVYKIRHECMRRLKACVERQIELEG